MNKTLIAFALCTVAHFAHGQGLPVNVFIQALKAGKAEEELPRTPETEALAKAVHSKTGNSGPLFIKAMRIVRFAQQSTCGRVTFVIAQPAANIAWKDLGGELNICESGLPPWRVCASNPKELVPADATCRDKSRPIDTPEVAAAIQDSLKNGGLSHEQVRASLVQQQADRQAKEPKK